MNRLLNFFSIFGLLGLVLSLGVDGALTAEIGAVILIVGVLILALSDKAASIGKVLVALFSIGYLCSKHVSNGIHFVELAVCLSALALALFGYYIMFGGLSRNK